ncbi:MAG: class I SAM-dependent methyltransferase [Planctomycetota bacterium]
MGDANQLGFVQRLAGRLSGPYLEVGSHDYGTTQDLRSLFPDQDYVGVDMIDGPGVDRVLDLTAPMADIDAALDGRRFGAIFCLSVLEHCEQPFAMAERLTDLLRPGGSLVVSVPWVFRFHGYPSDYWRFTHEGVKKLFPRLEFDDALGCASSPKTGEEQPLDPDLGRFPLSGSWHRRRGRWGAGLGLDLLKLASTVGLGRALTRHRYAFVPTLVNMVGVRPESPAT